MLPSWGTEHGALAFMRRGYGAPDEPLPPSSPYNEPDFITWNARLARFAATPASYEAFERMWFATDVIPLLATISVPFATLYSTLDPGDEQVSRAEAALIPAARMVGFAGPSAIIWVHEPEPIVSAIEQFIFSVHHEEAALDRMLATVLFTDIVSSTDKACQLGDTVWRELLGRQDAVVRAFLSRYRGDEVKTTGDGFLATFDGPARAVKCAQGICEAVRSLGLEVRAGCHTGEIEQLGADVGGVAVHIGARVGRARRALRGPRHLDGQGPRGRLRPRLRRPRRAPPQGHPGGLAPLRTGGGIQLARNLIVGCVRRSRREGR